MKKKNYSVIIVSGATSTNKEFVLSSKLIHNALIAFAVLLVIFGFVIFDYLTISFDKERMKQLETDNVEKEKTIAKLTTRFEEINRSVSRMEDYKQKIMVAAGLLSPYALKEVGSGGPDGLESGMGPTTLNPIENVPSSQEAPQIARGINGRRIVLDSADELVGKAKEIEKSLGYVRSHLNEQKARLASTPALWPTRGILTDPFGIRVHPFTGKRSMHWGQDIATQHGNPVSASADGIVIQAEYTNYFGNCVQIDHGFGFTTLYGHLSGFKVKEGDRVKREQVIGYVGNTGRSTAPHLHYEVSYMGKNQNPMKFIILD